MGFTMLAFVLMMCWSPCIVLGQLDESQFEDDFPDLSDFDLDIVSHFCGTFTRALW